LLFSKGTSLNKKSLLDIFVQLQNAIVENNNIELIFALIII
jgi:hypothetical protein